MAVAVVGGAFLAASFQVLFDKLSSRGIGDIIWGRKLEEGLLVKKLTVTLLSVEATLNDDVRKRTSNTAVMEWLRELEGTVNIAQSLLEEIAVHGPRFTSKSRSSRIKSIREILERLEHMRDQKDVLDLVELPDVLRTTSIPVHESDIVGRADDKEGIVTVLLSNHDANPIQVMGIVGVPGIGKTTLAQLVYNDSRVVDHFSTKVWVSVSRRPDTYAVTKTIFKAVTSSPCEIDDLNLLQLRLGEQLVGKRLLLVLDDVTGIEDCTEWDILITPFRYCARGSAIIVTTRSESVAGMVRNLPVHHLNMLSDEDCWVLFSRHAFDARYPATDPELEAIGRDIARKCRGIPLAAKTVGVILRKIPECKEWDKILKADAWDSSRDVTDILLKLRKGMATAWEKAREQVALRNGSAILNNSVPPRTIISKRSRLAVFCVIWFILLGIASVSVFKTTNMFHARRRNSKLAYMCDIRAKVLQDQFEHHASHSFSFAVFLIQFHSMQKKLDDNQCGAALYDYASGVNPMFPFLGTISFEIFNARNEYSKPVMACYTRNSVLLDEPLISSKMDIMNAIVTSRTVLSTPFKESHPHHYYFALIVPLYSNEYPVFNSTAEQRIAASSGYIGMLFEFDNMAEQAIRELDGNETISMAVHDVTNSSEYYLLYRSSDYENIKSHVHESRLELGDLFRKHKITCWYRQEAPLSWVIIAVTGLTVAIGLLLGGIFLGAAISSLRIQELEAQARAFNAARSSLLATASREIRIPASGILETLALVLSTDLSSPQKDYIRVAQEGCKRLIGLIDEVADI